MTEQHLHHISPHVYWMNPAPYDRPSLAVVVGADHTLMLDAGASPAHTTAFLKAVEDAGLRAPRYVALTHWHWDHIFGLPLLAMPIIAHVDTAAELKTLATYAWDDDAIAERVRQGIEIESSMRDIQLEMPAPRTITIKQPDILMTQSLSFDLGGGVICNMVHVGGDHAADSCVMHIPSDKVLFMGDCWYGANYSPAYHYTSAKILPLLDTILGFDAEKFIEGHGDQVLSRAEVEQEANHMRYASDLVATHHTREAAEAVAQAAGRLNEDLSYYIEMFVAGRTLHPTA